VRDELFGAKSTAPVSRRSLIAIAVAVAASAIHRWSFAGQTFFMDEIWVVQMVREGRYWPGIPQPVLFFWSSVASSRLCGFSESCLRLPALISALLLTLVPLLAWRRGVLEAPAAAAWTVLLAFSSPIVFYAARTKQYPTEALGAAVILVAFLGVLAGTTRLRTYLGICAVLVPLLHSMPFVILGTGLALTWFAARANRRAAMRVFLGHIALGALFVVAYLAYMRPRPATTAYFGDLYDYFRANAEPVFFDGTLRFLMTRTAHWMGHCLNMTPLLAMFSVIAVAAWIALHRRDAARVAIAIACITPPAAVLAASVLEVYPYGEVRLMIFTAPALFLLIALAMRDLASRWRTASLVFIGALAVFVFREIRMQPYNATYMGTRDLHATYAFISRTLPPGVPILCSGDDAVPLRFYVPRANVVVVPNGAREISLPVAKEVWMLLERKKARGVVLHEQRGLVVSRLIGPQ
jgi:hypothetical protein